MIFSFADNHTYNVPRHTHIVNTDYDISCKLFCVTNQQYQALYIAARGKWPRLVRNLMRELQTAYTASADRIAAQLRAAAESGKSQLTIDMLTDLQAQLMSGAEAIAAMLQKTVPEMVTAGYANYAKIDNAMIAELMGATVTAEGLATMTVGVNNRLIANLLNRTWQDGYTFSERVFQVGGDYQEQIKRLVASGIAQGRSTIKIAKDIQDYVAKGRGALNPEYGNAKFGEVVAKKVDWRALRIARSELGASMQEASIEQAALNPAATGLVNWVRINTQIHDCKCPELAAGSPYQIPGRDLGRPEVPARPHSNCHPAGTIILTSKGNMPIENVMPGDIVVSHDGSTNKITHKWINQYSGKMLELKTDNGSIRATPEHPLLSNGAWVAAHELKPGDNISNIFVDIEAFPFVENIANGFPSERGDKSLFFSILYLLSPTGMPITAIDFDGELYIAEGQINTEVANSEIWDRALTYSENSLIQQALVNRPDSALIKLGDFSAMFRRLPFASDSIMCGCSVIGSSISIGSEMALCNCGCGEPLFDKVSSNATARYAELFGYSLYREIIVPKQFDKHISVNLYFGTHNSAIVNVTSEYFNGIVYNLTVENKNSYIANGFASHNCMCQVRPILNDLNTVADDIQRWHNGESVPYLDEWAARYRSMT